MTTRFRFTRKSSVVATVLVAIVASAVVTVTAVAASGGSKSEHWGVITRNTIGSPVAELRDGPYGSFGVTGPSSEPPFGKGSLGIEVANPAGATEKVAFGNEVDFLGDPVLGLSQVGFRVFQTQENIDVGGPRNMPNITFEIDPNLATSTSNYTSMVWDPPASPVVDQWSGYIDATTTGDWYLTGVAGTASGCNQTTMCTFTQLMNAFNANNNGTPPTIYTVAIAKGRDNQWQGAVDGLRINSKVYDFEAQPEGVKTRNA